MAGRIHVGGIGKKYLDLLGRFRFRVAGGGPTKGVVTVRVHPDDLEDAEEMFRRSRLVDALSSTGSALMFTSVFTSAFHGICVSGLLAVRGFSETKRELLERAFPQTPDRLLCIAREVHAKTLQAKNLKPGGCGGGGGGGGIGGGSEPGGDSDGGGGSVGGGASDSVVGGGLDNGGGSSLIRKIADFVNPFE